MTLIIPCPRCGGRFLGASEFEAHKCDDAISKVPQLDDIRARLDECFTCAVNHSASAIDQAFRVALLLPTFLMLAAARWLARREREVGRVTAIQLAERRDHTRLTPGAIVPAKHGAPGALFNFRSISRRTH
ncbi:MAG: hypothetical protein JWO13_2247 [Acidobacteriales bacterium]|nr:hypothetical protein [Terriglobales bacterium]